TTIDFVKSGYDEDLGVVRMGVRDYDPRINRFLTPDPLLLADLEAAGERTVEANLYSYARNNPLVFEDAAGTQANIMDTPEYKNADRASRGAMLLAMGHVENAKIYSQATPEQRGRVWFETLLMGFGEAIPRGVWFALGLLSATQIKGHDDVEGITN